MPTAEAQRTLVKSPPELWAELSDPVALARHLGEVGEIRIARVKGETSVEWEADAVSGTIKLKPSGWGTRVTLTIAREAPQPAVAKPEPAEPEPAEPKAVEPEPAEPKAVADAVEPEASPEPVMEPAAEQPTPAPTALESAKPEPEPEPERTRRFARLGKLFRWRRRASRPPAEPAAEAMSEPETTEPETTSAAEVAPAAAAKPETQTNIEPDGPSEAEPEQKPQTPGKPQTPDRTGQSPEVAADLALELAAELARLEEVMVAQDAELLSAVLDRLGAAHHRPFSRG